MQTAKRDLICPSEHRARGDHLGDHQEWKPLENPGRSELGEGGVVTVAGGVEGNQFHTGGCRGGRWGIYKISFIPRCAQYTFTLWRGETCRVVWGGDQIFNAPNWKLACVQQHSCVHVVGVQGRDHAGEHHPRRPCDQQWWWWCQCSEKSYRENFLQESVVLAPQIKIR